MIAPPVPLPPLWAVHISDGVLTPPWWIGGFVLISLLVLFASLRVRDEEIPRIAVFSSAFFVASLIHFRVGPTSIHLLLNGLVGVVLGRRAPLAIAIGLGLQAALLGHGGFTSLGVNACVMTLPALLAAGAFALLSRLELVRKKKSGFIWFLGFLIGAGAVLATLVLNAFALLYGGAEAWDSIVRLVFVAHLPIVAIEGVVVGFTIGFLARVKPEMLGCSCPSMVVLMLLFMAGPAQAHRPAVDYSVLANGQVKIEGWFDPGDHPMKGAKVQVFRPGRQLLVEGRMDDKGEFVFRYREAEPLDVIVNGGAGHRAELMIPGDKLGENAALIVEKDAPRTDRPSAWRERFKDALLGVAFLLALGAFVLSWRNGRKLRQLGA